MFWAIAGAALQIAGNIDANEAAARIREEKAALAAKNRAASRLAAVQAKADASYEAMRLQMRADTIVARQRVVGGAGNVDMSGGTPLRLQSDTRLLSEMDKHVAILRGIQKAAGYILQGDTFSAQAAIDSIAADSARLGTALDIAGTLTQAGAQIASWYEKNQGPDTTSGYYENQPSQPGDYTPHNGIE